jgi:hypothetical protein
MLRPEGHSLALHAAHHRDASSTHLARAQFHATHAHHADIAHTQNSHRASSRPPTCSHSETNRPRANFHRPCIPRPPLLIQPHFAQRVSGVVSYRRIHAALSDPPRPFARATLHAAHHHGASSTHLPSDPFLEAPALPACNANAQNCRTPSSHQAAYYHHCATHPPTSILRTHRIHQSSEKIIETNSLRRRRKYDAANDCPQVSHEVTV